jgi:uncharacterized protein
MRFALAMRVGLNPAEKTMVEVLHRQRVLHMIEAFYRRDIEGALSHCCDDVDFFCNAPIDILPHLGHHQGKAEMREMWETVYRRYSSMRYQIPNVIAEGDQVAVNIRAFLGKRRNDRIVQFDFAAFYTLRDGRIAKIREIIDTFDLVQQLVERDLAGLLTENMSSKI